MGEDGSRFIHWIWRLVFCCLLLVGCTPDGLFADKDCQPPCWLGIVAGETAESDVLDLLKSSNIIRSHTIRERTLESTPPSDSHYEFEFTDGGVGRVYLRDGRVSHMYISRFSEPTLGEFLVLAGEPDYLIVSDITQKISGYSAVLYYLDEGIKVQFRVAADFQDIYEVRDGAANVAAGMNGYETWIFPPQPTFEAFLEATGIEGEYLETVLAQDNAWKGYGFYKFTP